MVAQFIINEASADDQRKIVSQLELETSEKLCALLPPEETAALLEELPADIAADVVEEMNADVGGHLLRALNEEDSEAILAEFDDRQESEDLRERVGFDEDCADSLMSDQVSLFPPLPQSPTSLLIFRRMRRITSMPLYNTSSLSIMISTLGAC